MTGVTAVPKSRARRGVSSYRGVSQKDAGETVMSTWLEMDASERFMFLERVKERLPLRLFASDRRHPAFGGAMRDGTKRQLRPD